MEKIGKQQAVINNKLIFLDFQSQPPNKETFFGLGDFFGGKDLSWPEQTDSQTSIVLIYSMYIQNSGHIDLLHHVKPCKIFDNLYWNIHCFYS